MSEHFTETGLIRPCPDCADVTEYGIRAQCETCGGAGELLIRGFDDIGLPIYQTVVGREIDRQFGEIFKQGIGL